MRKLFSILLFALVAFFAQAQTPSDYKVERDTSGGFLLLQGGQRTPFDTATLQVNLKQKQEEQQALETEIQLLERLVMLRRQVQVSKSEQSTLLDIINKARTAPALVSDQKRKGSKP